MASTNTIITGFVVVFAMIILTGFIITGFNDATGETNELGLDTGGLSELSNVLGGAYDETGGEVTQVDNGLSLPSSWAMGKALLDVAWNVVNGSIIYNTVMLLNLGQAGNTVALILRLMFVAILIFSVIKLFFKVML